MLIGEVIASHQVMHLSVCIIRIAVQKQAAGWSANTIINYVFTPRKMAYIFKEFEI